MLRTILMFVTVVCQFSINEYYYYYLSTAKLQKLSTSVYPWLYCLHQRFIALQQSYCSYYFGLTEMQ